MECLIESQGYGWAGDRHSSSPAAELVLGPHFQGFASLSVSFGRDISKQLVLTPGLRAEDRPRALPSYNVCELGLWEEARALSCRVKNARRGSRYMPVPTLKASRNAWAAGRESYLSAACRPVPILLDVVRTPL